MAYPLIIKKDGTNFRIPDLVWNDNEKKYDIVGVVNDDEFVSMPVDEDGN